MWQGLSRRRGNAGELGRYPPYHSKYNPIERGWSSLQKKWNGVLLTCWQDRANLRPADEMERRAPRHGSPHRSLPHGREGVTGRNAATQPTPPTFGSTSQIRHHHQTQKTSRQVHLLPPLARAEPLQTAQNVPCRQARFSRPLGPHNTQMPPHGPPRSARLMWRRSWAGRLGSSALDAATETVRTAGRSARSSTKRPSRSLRRLQHQSSRRGVSP